MPRFMLFGLVRVPMYEYEWGHTAAQIDLIDIDQPYTAFERNRGLKPGDKGYKPSETKLKRTVEEWKKRKEEREKKGFSLSHFLGTGEKVPTDD